MLKEEKELRLLCKTVHDTKFYPIATKQITALVLAVREDCAKVGAESIKNCMRSPKIEVQEKVDKKEIKLLMLFVAHINHPVL